MASEDSSSDAQARLAMQATRQEKQRYVDTLNEEVKVMQTVLDLQAKLGVSQKEALRIAQQSVSAKVRVAEQTLTETVATRDAARQRREQAALNKAGILTPQQAFAEAGMQVAQGKFDPQSLGTLAGTLIGKVGRFGHPGVMAASLAATAAFTLADGYFSSKDKDAAMKNRLKEKRAQDAQELGEIGGIFGTGGDAVEAGLRTSKEIKQREAHREELKRQSQFGWYNPLRWSDAMFGTNFQTKGFLGWRSEGARAIEENESEVARLKEQESKLDKIRQEKFDKGEGGLQLKIARARARHDASGLREARAHEAVSLWRKTYQESIAAGANDSQAAELADSGVDGMNREIEQRAAKFVNAKSGAAETARAATIAMNSLPDQAEVRRGIDEMHSTLRGGLGQLNEHTSRHRF